MSEKPEPLYTLREAKQVLAEQECGTHGHSWDFVMTYRSKIPVQLICGSCGVSADVKPND